MPFVETAYAKINLALHIRKRRDDGYHELETLFAFAEHGDVLSAEPADTFSLTISGQFAAGLSNGTGNLVIQAASQLQGILGTTKGASLHLDKHLPVAAGIGGGSADAAAALRLLPRLWGIEPDLPALHALAASLGADVPACIASQTVRGEGVGDVLIPVKSDTLKGKALLLANPGIPCPTGPVFKAWDGVDRGPLDKADVWQATLAGRNDLELPARGLLPEISDLLSTIQALPGVTLARMSGSGATCFAIFDSHSLAEQGAARLPVGYWSLVTSLR